MKPGSSSPILRPKDMTSEWHTTISHSKEDTNVQIKSEIHAHCLFLTQWVMFIRSLYHVQRWWIQNFTRRWSITWGKMSRASTLRLQIPRLSTMITPQVTHCCKYGNFWPCFPTHHTVWNGPRRLLCIPEAQGWSKRTQFWDNCNGPSSCNTCSAKASHVKTSCAAMNSDSNTGTAILTLKDPALKNI